MGCRKGFFSGLIRKTLKEERQGISWGKSGGKTCPLWKGKSKSFFPRRTGHCGVLVRPTFITLPAQINLSGIAFLGLQEAYYQTPLPSLLPPLPPRRDVPGTLHRFSGEWRGKVILHPGQISGTSLPCQPIRPPLQRHISSLLLPMAPFNPFQPPSKPPHDGSLGPFSTVVFRNRKWHYRSYVPTDPHMLQFQPSTKARDEITKDALNPF